MFGSSLPSLWSLSNQSLLGSGSRHCYVITYLGAQFRRFRTRLGAPIAIKAMAAKLARLVYRILRYGMKYVDQGTAFYQAQHRNLQIKHLKSKAASLGYQLIQVPAA